MEEGSPRNSSFLNHDFNPTMSFITPPQQQGKRQFRTAEAGDDLQHSHLAFLQNMQMQPSPLGLMLSSTPGEFGHSNLNSQDQEISTSTMMFQNCPPNLRSMGGIRNPSDVLTGPTLTMGNYSSNYSQPSGSERRTIWSNSSSNVAGFGQGYSLYDERYQAMGLPVDPHLRIFNATNGNGKSSD